MEQTADHSTIDPLTDRELQILSLMADGLTDRDISQELFLALATVKWYNRRIYEKLAVRNRTEAVARAREGGLFDAPQTTLSTTTPRTTLPASLTSFIGRTQEVAEIRRLLNTARLVTLVGPPGTGKTRLSLEVAHAVADQFPNAVTFVPLAPLSHPHEVLESIAQILDAHQAQGQSVIEAVIESLHGRPSLLILDNFEHLLDAASLTQDLLRQAPDLVILATSREVLRVYGEHVYNVPPLPLPDQHVTDTDEIAEYDAIRLFTQRAKASAPHFRATADNLRTVAEICTRLDGLPLPIELAAARMRLFTPDALLARLDDRFETIRGQQTELTPHHQTLRDTIDWSYDLLDPDEQILLSRLSIFRGGHTLEAADEICAPDLAIDVLDSIESLLDKSLIQLSESSDTEPRFMMLETIHTYAREKLELTGEMTLMRHRHADYYVALAEDLLPDTRGGPRQRAALQRLVTDQDNLLVVLRWSFGEGNLVLGLRLVGALALFWFRQAHPSMWQYWQSRALALVKEANPLVQGRVYLSASYVAHMAHDTEQSTAMAREAVALFRTLPYPQETAWALLNLSQCLDQIGAGHEAHAVVDEALELFVSIGDAIGQSHAYAQMGEIARTEQDYSRAREVYLRGLSMAEHNGDTLGQCVAYANLAATATAEGKGAEALGFARQAARLQMSFNNPHFTLTSLVDISGPLALLGQVHKAATLLGAVEVASTSYRITLQPSDERLRETYTRLTREALTEAAFAEAWSAGQAMSLNEAIALAMQDSDP